MWSQARDHYQQCLEVLTGMQNDGMLSPHDGAMPEETRAEIARCDAALAQAAAGGGGDSAAEPSATNTQP
jgi:hypothetical protein